VEDSDATTISFICRHREVEDSGGEHRVGDRNKCEEKAMTSHPTGILLRKAFFTVPPDTLSSSSKKKTQRTVIFCD